MPFQILQFILVFKYYLNTQILLLVFEYLLGVFKYSTTAHNNHPVKKICISSITVHVLDLHDIAELSEDQRHMSKIF